METVTIGSSGAAAAMAATITMFGVLSAAAVLSLFRRRLALLVLVVPVLLGSFAWWLYLTPFYAVELTDSNLTLKSYYPTRSVVLTRDDIAAVDRQTKVTKNDYSVTLIVKTKDGRVFTSGNTTVTELFAVWTRVEEWRLAEGRRAPDQTDLIRGPSPPHRGSVHAPPCAQSPTTGSPTPKSVT